MQNKIVRIIEIIDGEVEGEDPDIVDGEVEREFPYGINLAVQAMHIRNSKGLPIQSSDENFHLPSEHSIHIPKIIKFIFFIWLILIGFILYVEWFPILFRR